MIDKLFVAMKAFIEHDGKILILREANTYADGTNTGKFDVPGGRVKPGNRFDENLRREIREETGLEVDIVRPFHVDEWRPEVRGEKWQIIGTFFHCKAKGSDITLSEEHDAFEWIDPENYKDYNLIPNLQAAFEAYNAR